jgi:hypothetical protein
MFVKISSNEKTHKKKNVEMSSKKLRDLFYFIHLVILFFMEMYWYAVSTSCLGFGCWGSTFSLPVPHPLPAPLSAPDPLPLPLPAPPVHVPLPASPPPSFHCQKYFC